MHRRRHLLSKLAVSALHSHNSYHSCISPYQHHLLVQTSWQTEFWAPQKLATYCICLHPVSSPYWVDLYSYKLHVAQWTTAFSEASISAHSHHHAYSVYKSFCDRSEVCVSDCSSVYLGLSSLQHSLCNSQEFGLFTAYLDWIKEPSQIWLQQPWCLFLPLESTMFELR